MELQTHSLLKFLLMPGEFCLLSAEYAVLTGLIGELVKVIYMSLLSQGWTGRCGKQNLQYIAWLVIFYLRMASHCCSCCIKERLAFSCGRSSAGKDKKMQ